MLQRITSSQLLALADQRPAEDGCLESYLFLNGGLRATHFTAANGDGTYFDEGIDGASRTVTADEFLRDYPDALGAIWHVEGEASDASATDT